mgnify:CR=1 FL=1
MNVKEFIKSAKQLNGSKIAVVRDMDKLSGTFRLSETGVMRNILEIFDVTHYHGIYIDDYEQIAIPLNTITAIYVEE